MGVAGALKVEMGNYFSQQIKFIQDLCYQRYGKQSFTIPKIERPKRIVS